jgi:hypothetical protein
MNAIVSMYERWEEYVREIWVEKNSFGAIHIQQLQRTSLPVKPVVMTAKNALRNSIHHVAVLFENQLVRLPYGDAYSQKYMDTFCDELVAYPSTGMHDDTICSFMHGVSALKKVGNTYSVAVGDKVLNHLGENIAEDKHIDAVSNVLAEMGVISQKDEYDELDPMAQRFTGLMD